MPMPSNDKFALEGETCSGLDGKPPLERDPLALPGAFASALVAWFEAEGRDYPWRRTRDPYAVLVSEVMLQQTQIATVLSKRYFERWLENFPDVETLAAAQQAEVLKAWEGLGYYRRARNLQAAARCVINEYGGQFPRDVQEILKLPGVGRYTAGAVASFAYGDAAPIVDGNIARVLSRLFDFHQEVDRGPGQRQLWEWAEALLPGATAVRAYNSALMELGQTICRKSATACHRCPVSDFCATPDPSGLPRKKAAQPTEEVVEMAAFAVKADQGVLLEQIPAGQRREGLWRLPNLITAPPGTPKVLLRSRYAITRYRVELIVYQVDGNLIETQSGPLHDQTQRAPKRSWFTGKSLEEVAMPAPYRKAVNELLA